jgi:hypothetical protein
MKAMVFVFAMLMFGRLIAQQPTLEADFFPSFDGTTILGLGISKFQGAVVVGDGMYKIRSDSKKELFGFRTFKPITLITEEGIVIAYSLWFDGTDWIPMFAKLVDRYGVYDKMEEEEKGMPTIYWHGYKIHVSLMIFERTQFAISASLRVE